MASSFARAVNQRLKAALQKATQIAGQARERAKSNWQKLRDNIGTWQDSRRRFERAQKQVENTKARIEETPRRPTPGLETEQTDRRRIIRDAEYDMRINEDPAFGAWVNRIGRMANAPIVPGKTITESRLNYLIELFGVEDALGLYEKVTGDENFGFEFFRVAYAEDGKNRGAYEGHYKLSDAIGMNIAQDDLFSMYEIYKVFL